MDTGSGPGYQFSCGLNGGGNFLPVSAFSAFNLLRNCNYLLNGGSAPSNALPVVPNIQEKIPPISQLLPQISQNENCSVKGNPRLDVSAADVPPISTKGIFSPAALLNLNHSVESLLENSSPNSRPPPSLLLSPNFCESAAFRKHRSEKKPIPDEQKDDKYFERRRRNNQAAKKSRDARKMREDQIALRATILEHENAILRAQILTLREEASSLRQMLLQTKSFELHSRDQQICLS